MFTSAKSNTPLVSVTKPVELSILTWHISSLANNRLIVPDLAHKNVFFFFYKQGVPLVCNSRLLPAEMTASISRYY